MIIPSEDGEIERVSAAEERAHLLRAHRLHEARLLRASDEELARIEESVEAEAGAILEAETQVEIHELHTIARSWAKAHEA